METESTGQTCVVSSSRATVGLPWEKVDVKSFSLVSLDLLIYF